MADSFGLRRGGQYETQIVAIEREIKERVDGCMRPQCWVLKDEKDIGKMYIGKKVTTDGKGRYVYIRRYLFLLPHKLGHHNHFNYPKIVPLYLWK